jgi:uncharacterized protein YbjT (DUF2867 family)
MRRSLKSQGVGPERILMRVLVTGATGFVGKRLTPRLVEAGFDVRAMTRRPDAYTGAGEPVGGDVSDTASLRAALHGCSAAYYLVHSLDSSDFVQRDADAARRFAEAAADSGVERLVYLGGLGDDTDELSAHLRSRRQVEGLLGGTGVPVTVLRAGIVIGNEGISWELLRQLVVHLPVMVTPRWVGTRSQPIALDDVLSYLVGVLDEPKTGAGTYEIGGPEVLTYAEMMHRVGKQLHRPVVLLPVPLLTPRLSSLWLSLVTSVDTGTARSLVDSMTNEVVVRDPEIRSLLPLDLIGFDEAVRRALLEREEARATA